MRIEILVDNQEPRIFSLDRPNIVIGSHQTCTIVINHKGISRKHLVITNKDGKYFVVDQGSTNGSYINEHRLLPGISTEFNSFFPVRLSHNVIMTLLSDDAAEALGEDSELNNSAVATDEIEESTKMLSVKDLKKNTTSELAKKRHETITKRKTLHNHSKSRKKNDASNSKIGFISILIIAGASYYQFFVKEMNVKTDLKKEENKTEVELVDDRPIKRIDFNNVPTYEAILAVLKKPRCSTDLEKKICLNMPLIYQEKSGTVIYDKTIVIVSDGLKYEDQAKSYVGKPKSLEQGGTKVEINTYQFDLNLMMLILWMNDNIPTSLPELLPIDDYTIVVAFADIKPEPAKLLSASVFIPESFFRLRKRISDQNLTKARTNGTHEFSYAYEYLRFL